MPRMREAAGPCGLLMRLDAHMWQSQAQGGTSHTHVPWGKLLWRIHPPNPPSSLHATWGLQGLALPCATLLPVEGPGHCGLRCPRSPSCPDNRKNRNFTSRLNHVLPTPALPWDSQSIARGLCSSVCCGCPGEAPCVTETASGDPRTGTRFLRGFHHSGVGQRGD